MSKDKDMFVLDYETPDGKETIQSKSIALTVPSYVAADLLQSLSVPDLADLLAQRRHVCRRMRLTP